MRVRREFTPYQLVDAYEVNTLAPNIFLPVTFGGIGFELQKSSENL